MKKILFAAMLVLICWPSYGQNYNVVNYGYGATPVVAPNFVTPYVYYVVPNASVVYPVSPGAMVYSYYGSYYTGENVYWGNRPIVYDNRVFYNSYTYPRRYFLNYSHYYYYNH